MKKRTKILITGKSNSLSYAKSPHCREPSSVKGFDHEAGFTLMEMIIVCLLISLILTITIPTLRNSLYTNELTATARKIIGTVKELRNLAIREQQSYLLHFDVDKNSIWYELDDDKDLPDEEAIGDFPFPAGIQLDDVEAHTQGKKSFGSVILWINKRGYMDQTVVHLSDEGGDNLTLFFSPFSGSAQVYEDYVEIE